jgi:hypothetical protein
MNNRAKFLDFPIFGRQADPDFSTAFVFSPPVRG